MTVDDKIALLLCAIRHSGKTDWASVGQEMGIKTNTAFMRHTYIIQGHEKATGVATPKGMPSKSTSSKKTPTPRKSKGSSAKKMKKNNGEATGVDDGDVNGGTDDAGAAGLNGSGEFPILIY